VHCRAPRVRFNAIDMAQLSTSGGNLLRIWTLCEYALKPLASFKSGDETKVRNVVSYADEAWLPDDVLVGLPKTATCSSSRMPNWCRRLEQFTKDRTGCCS
jgi:hypothetical protein